MAGRRARRKKILRRRLMVGVWMLCLLALGVAFVLRNSVTAANGGKEGGGFLDAMGNAFSMGQNAGSLVQGIPEKAFASHPRWEENFLTPNEYSRPGDALESVENVLNSRRIPMRPASAPILSSGMTGRLFSVCHWTRSPMQ